MSKQNTATKILAAIIGTPAVATKSKISPIAYATAEEFESADSKACEFASDVPEDSVKTYAGNCFHAFEDGSVLVSWEWRKAIAAFASIDKAAECVGDDPRRLYSDFGVFA